MGQIEKGVILTIEGEQDRNGNATQARVQSTTAEGTSTLPLTIPWYLRGAMGSLEKGTKVAYCLFDDATGVILTRMDGNWEGKMEETQLVVDMQDNKAEIMGDLEMTGSVTSEGDMTTNGSINVTNDITANTVTASTITDNGVVLHSHTHTGVTPGSDNTGQPNK